MASFDSPLGNKKVTSGVMREFTVPDESDSQEGSVIINGRARQDFDFDSIDRFQQESFQTQSVADFERDIRSAKEARRNGKEKITSGAKSRIEALIGMNRTVREVKIENVDYVLEALKAKEMRAAIISAAEYDGTSQFMFEIRKQFLARSLKSIGGLTIEEFISSNSFEDKLGLIDELDDSLSNRLYEEYVKLSEDSKKKFSITTDSDVQEVASDLKK